MSGPVSVSPEDGERGPGLASTEVSGPGSGHLGHFPWLFTTTARWGPTEVSDPPDPGAHDPCCRVMPCGAV